MAALYTLWYNFSGIKSAVAMRPTMATRLTKSSLVDWDIAKLIEDWEEQV